MLLCLSPEMMFQQLYLTISPKQPGRNVDGGVSSALFLVEILE